MSSIPKVRYEPVECPRYWTYVFFPPSVKLTGLDDLFLDFFSVYPFVEYFISAMKKGAVHVFLFQVPVDVSYGARPFGRAVDHSQYFDVCFNGVTVK